MRGVIYARYSEGPRQTDQSIEGQVSDCRAYAERKGIQILEIYADRHVSGKSIDGRDEFQRMIKDAEKGLFDCIIVWKVDRFGRSREDIAVNKIRLRKAGVTLLYAQESIPDGPEGILLESLMEGLAEYYSADLRQKVVRGMTESAKKGRVPFGSLPIGYKRGEDGTLQISEPEAEAVREVFRAHIGGATLNELRQLLLDRGIVSRAGGLPSKHVVERMLRNERYTGRFSFQNVEIQAPAIIDDKTFAEAAEHFKTSRFNGSGNGMEEYLLSTKCVCGICGQRMTVGTGTGRHGGKYHYYRCKGKCQKPVRQSDLEDLVLTRTIKDVLTDEMIEDLTDRIMAIQDAQAQDDPAAVLQKRLESVQRKQKNLLGVLEEGGSKMILERLKELDAEADALQLEIDRAALKKPQIPRALVRGWLQSFREGDVSDPAFRKRLLQTFVSDVVVTPDEVTVLYNSQKTPLSEGSPTAPLVDFGALKANPWITPGGQIVLQIQRRPGA